MDRFTAEHKYLSSCNLMALSRSGTLALLVGDRQMGLIDLDKPKDLLHKSPRNQKFQVNEVQFSLEDEGLWAIAAGKKAELHKWRPEGGEAVLQATLKGHGNIVSDLSFHEQDTHLIATSSHDNTVRLWDIRTPLAPTFTIKCMHGISRICWERRSGTRLAGCYMGEIKIWDIRSSNQIPIQYIDAHADSRIFWLDYSPVKENQLASVSCDSTIKMWDAGSGAKPVEVIKLQENNLLYRKVKYTPFGEGLVSLTYTEDPKLKDQNNLLLWSVSADSNYSGPVHKFYGHSDAIQEFAWRNVNPCANRDEFQLVTWSRDANLTLWPIGQYLEKMCGKMSDEEILADNAVVAETLKKASVGSAPGASAANGDVVNGHQNQASNLSNGASSLGDLSNELENNGKETLESFLKRELKVVKHNEKIIYNTIDLFNHRFVFQAETHTHVIFLELHFPGNYPKAPPEFSFGNRTTLNQERGSAISKRLRNIAQGLTSKGMSCLNQVLKAFQDEISSIIQQEQTNMSSQVMKTMPDYYRDSNVPYPRISGARFCGRGQLVCFGYTFSVPVPKLHSDDKSSSAGKTPSFTPRSLSAITGNAAAATKDTGASGADKTASGFMLKAKLTKEIPDPPPPPPPPSGSKTPIKNGGARHKMVRITSMPASGQTHNSKQKRTESTSSEPNFAFKEEDPRSQLLPFNTKSFITIYDASRCIHFNIDMARNYLTSGPSIEAVCKHNAKIAHRCGRIDVCRAWCNVSRIERLLNAADRKIYADYHKKALKVCATETGCSCPPDSEELDLEHRLSMSEHPLGRRLLQSYIDHYKKFNDFQTVAMLCAVFSQSLPDIDPEVLEETIDNEVLQIEKKAQVKEEPDYYVKAVSSSFEAIPSLLSRFRLNSESIEDRFSHIFLNSKERNDRTSSEGDDMNASDIPPTGKDLLALPAINSAGSKSPALSFQPDTESASVKSSISVLLEKEREKVYPVLFLDYEQRSDYDKYRKLYGSMLYRWQLLIAATHINKSCQDEATFPLQLHDGETKKPYANYCQICKEKMLGTMCQKCKRVSRDTNCSICSHRVKGLSWYCLACGHGGHFKHMKNHFSTNTMQFCPKGCGCQCMDHYKVQDNLPQL